MTALQKNIDYQQLVEQIGNKYESAKTNIVKAVNTEMLYTYWEIGKYIIEFEQRGNLKADYGTHLLEKLSKDLSLQHGKGFSRSNLNYMRLLYHKYPHTWRKRLACAFNYNANVILTNPFSSE